MNRNIIMALAMVILSGCVSTKDMNSSIENASEKAAIKTATRLSKLYENNYFLDGIVVKIENHPISGLSSSGTHAITYHVEYELVDRRGGLLSPSEQIETNKYIVPITDYGREPKFKVGDKVKITGWIEKDTNDQVPSIPTKSCTP